MSQLNVIAFLHIIILKLLHYEDIVNYFSDQFFYKYLYHSETCQV